MATLITTTPVVEDYLATIYALAAEGKSVIGARLAHFLGVSAPTVTQTLQRMVKAGYIHLKASKEIFLTEKGREIAEILVRRHRLVERWLTDILGLDWVAAHEEAHRLEHTISPAVEDRLFHILGAPTTCPHGNPIPGSGADLSWIGLPLDRVRDGDEIIVDRITEEGENDRRLLEFLWENGLVPGARLSVVSVAPWADTVTLRSRDKEVHLGLAAAAKIWVRPGREGITLTPIEPSQAQTNGKGTAMEQEREFIVTVETVQGECKVGHQPGERFQFGPCTPNGLCGDAYHAMYSILETLRQKDAQAGEEGTTEPAYVTCPEDGIVTFKVELSHLP